MNLRWNYALLKAKYCLPVEVASCAQKTQERDLDLWPVTLKFNRLLEVVEVQVRTKFHQAKCSGSWVINSALDFGQLDLDFDREYLSNRSSNRQAENGVMNYDFFSRWVKTIW